MVVGLLGILAAAPQLPCRPQAIGCSGCLQRLRGPALGLILGESGGMHFAEQLGSFGIAGVPPTGRTEHSVLEDAHAAADCVVLRP